MTKSPILQTSSSSCAINFLEYFHLFLYLGIILYLSTSTFTVFCILSETTLPTRALRGVETRSFGGEWMREKKPGIVDGSFNSSFDKSLTFSEYW